MYTPITENVLAAYYPMWIRNCQESIRWIESGERTAFRAERGMAALTKEDDAQSVEYYKKKLAYYEERLAAYQAAACQSEGEPPCSK